MARWQFTKDGEPTTDDLFDDGQLLAPGEKGFSSAAAISNMPESANGCNYVGMSTPTEGE